MSFADNLKITSINLINKYGSNVELKTVTDDGVYNPQTGTYGTPSEVVLTKKAVLKPLTNKDLQQSSLPENMWSEVSTVATMVEDDDLLTLNNKWTLNGSKVVRIEKTTAQNKVIIIKVYCG